ncbi:MAG: tetratricopeptide repeat protein [Deltaproteobacteria bacterium]|nr:tetratricopeptide repeat protein [Deltaproteobacteria bacterium]
MVERLPVDAPGRNFCTQCGARLPRDARFCAGCGRAIVSLVVDDIEPPRASATIPLPSPASATTPLPAARGWREQALGLTVLAVFLAVGLGLWVTILRPGTHTPSAPSRQAPAETGGMPAGHPPTTLPDEAKKFIAGLVEKAAAAPDDVGAWKSLAHVQARAAEVEPSYAAAAVDSYKHVLGLAPDDDEAIHGLANVYYDRQEFAAAAEQYERYLHAHPDDPSVRTDLATTYLYQRQFDRAVDAYQEVIKAHPDFLQAHFNLGLAYEAMGKRDQALASLATARGLATDEPTRTQIDKITAQLKGEPARGPRMGPAPGTVADGAGSAAVAQASDFRGAVEAGLRAHSILGPKITAIDWPSPTQARVSVANFPMQSMPDFARNLFRARLETILDDAKTRFGTTGETSIDLVDAASGASMEHVTH